MLLTAPTDWTADVDRCGALLDRCGREDAGAVHPTFGPLTPREWGMLVYKHTDYHFRQFGA